MKSFPILAGTVLLAAIAVNARAQESKPMSMPMKPAADAKGSNVMTDGTVQTVDAKKGEVVLKHGDITNLGMPAMTMGFSVADKKMLDRVKVGDRVHFHVELVGGTPTVTRLEPVH